MGTIVIVEHHKFRRPGRPLSDGNYDGNGANPSVEIINVLERRDTTSSGYCLKFFLNTRANVLKFLLKPDVEVIGHLA